MTAWQFTNLIELEALAREKLGHGAFEYISGGADDEVTIRRNRDGEIRVVVDDERHAQAPAHARDGFGVRQLVALLAALVAPLDGGGAPFDR